MASWSPENATRAYLRSLTMGKRGKEPDVAEFISALAAGNNAQLMVEVCSGGAAATRSTTLALVAAVQQTGGRVVCVLPGSEDLNACRRALGPYSDRVELVAGDVGDQAARWWLLSEYIRRADFLLVDCHVDAVVDGEVLRGPTKEGGRVVVGYNAGVGCHGNKAAAVWGELKGHYLPIGEGLLLARVSGGGGGGESVSGWRCGGRGRGGSKWVVKVDKCTGEEHVFRVTSPHHKVCQLA